MRPTARLAAVVHLFTSNASWRRFYLARWVSVTGSTVAPIAVAFAVLDMGGGATGIGLVLITGPLVYMVVSPVAGVVADRFPRRMVLACCQAVSGAVQAAAAVLVLTHTASVPALAALELLAGAMGAFFKPAVQGLLAQLVAKESLTDANSTSQISNNLVAIGGPPVAGVVIAAAGPGWVLVWDAASFVISGLLFLRLQVASPPRRRGGGFVSDLMEGWTSFTGIRWVWSITLLSTVSSGIWAAGVSVLGPVYSRDHLGGPIAWGIVSAGMGAGLAGGSLAALLLRPRRAGLVCCAAMLPEAVLLAAMAAGAPLPVIAVAAAAAGGAGTLELVTYASTLQARLPEAQIGRILSVVGTVGTTCVPIAYALTGPLAGAVGVTTVLWAGAGAAVLAAGAAYSVRDVRELRAPAAPGSCERTSVRDHRHG